LLSPPFIGAYSRVVLFGRMGLVNRLLGEFGWSLPTIYGWRGILLVFIIQYFPFVFLFVSAALRSVDQSIEDAALSLYLDDPSLLATFYRHLTDFMILCLDRFPRLRVHSYPLQLDLRHMPWQQSPRRLLFLDLSAVKCSR
jgi:ABC-type uncharacterized transport system permease subunit